MFMRPSGHQQRLRTRLEGGLPMVDACGMQSIIYQNGSKFVRTVSSMTSAMAMITRHQHVLERLFGNVGGSEQ